MFRRFQHDRQGETGFFIAGEIFDFHSISTARITVTLLVISFTSLDEAEINWANTTPRRDLTLPKFVLCVRFYE